MLPVSASAIGRPIGHRSPVEPIELPLVGRDRELEILPRALHVQGTAERAGLIEIIGPPGIGKTRLVNELRAIGADRPQLTVGCERYESSIPYLLFRRIIRMVLGAAPDDDDAKVSARLDGWIAEHAPRLA